jgi:hypothetical protein
VIALAEFIGQTYPRTRVAPFHRQLGLFGRDETVPSEMRVLEQFLEYSDLLVDASAEFAVSYALADLARIAHIPYLSLSSTHGAWGGMVFNQLASGNQPCWMCLQHFLATDEVISPPSDPAGLMQPEGCSSPTFTGTSFDLMPVVAEAMRKAVSILTSGNIYPHLDWNLAVLALRSQTGAAIAPQWNTYQLDRHPSCENDQAHRY